MDIIFEDDADFADRMDTVISDQYARSKALRKLKDAYSLIKHDNTPCMRTARARIRLRIKYIQNLSRDEYTID